MTAHMENKIFMQQKVKKKSEKLWKWTKKNGKLYMYDIFYIMRF